MPNVRRELYRSANGDAWYLCRGTGGRVCVEHVPNAPSGGRVSQVDIATFLARGAQGPEHQALLDTIAGLLEEGAPENSTHTQVA